MLTSIHLRPGACGAIAAAWYHAQGGELRRLVLGRRNWLFTLVGLGGERAAHILTLLATAIAHGVNPRAYLHLLVSSSSKDGQAKLRELLPARILLAHPEVYVGERPLALPSAAPESSARV